MCSNVLPFLVGSFAVSSAYVLFAEPFLSSIPALSLRLVTVSSHTADNVPVLISDLSSLLFTLYHQPAAPFIFSLNLLFLYLSPLSSFPSLCLCVTSHAFNKKGHVGSSCTPGGFAWYTKPHTFLRLRFTVIFPM